MFRELVEAAAAEFGTVECYGPADDLQANPSVIVHSVPRYSNRNLTTRLWSWLKFLAVVAARLFTTRRKPLLFIVSNPPLAPVLGWLARKIKQQPYVLLFYDMYPEALMRFMRVPNRSIVVRVWRTLNRRAVRNADRVVTISPQLAQTVAQYWPDGDTAHVDIVPTWVDTDWIRPRPKSQNEFAIQHQQIDKLTVLYSGNLGLVHDLSLLPAVAQRLESYADIHFVIISGGPGCVSLEEECQRRKLSNVTFLPFQSETLLPLSLSAGDIALVALAAGGEGVSMPSKTYYLMAAGCALVGLCRDDSDVAVTIRHYQCGFNVGLGDVERAAQAILTLRNQPDLLRQYRENSRRAAEQHFSRTVCVPQMVKLIKQVAQGQN
jgi:colanic acid biosynthesis glycosyl transferase WcaI